MNYKEIRAIYTDTTIRVYQAYNSAIANEAVRLGTFGNEFKMTRMTWIKPSFLWMMYRCGWATKEQQERVLAIDIKREAFDFLVQNAVVSSYHESSFSSEEEWKEAVHTSDVRIQWDPERDIYGNPLDYRSLQLGLRGEAVKRYVTEWIVGITDITDDVVDLRERIAAKEDVTDLLPKEAIYPLKNNEL